MAEFDSREPPSRYLRLRFAGQMRCHPGHAYGIPRNHHLLHFVERGFGFLELPSGRRLIEGPAAFLIEPFERHRYVADLRRPWSYYWLGVDGQGAKSIFADCGFALGAPVLKTPRPVQARQAFAAVVALFRKPGRAAHTEALGHFHLFCAQLQAAYRPEPARPRHAEDARVAAACDFMEIHYRRPLTTAVVADQVGLERSYFSKIFARQKGLGIHQFLLHYRIRMAEQFMEKGGYSLRQVAQAVGYEDYATFERAFRRLATLTPRAFAQKHRSGG